MKKGITVFVTVLLALLFSSCGLINNDKTAVENAARTELRSTYNKIAVDDVSINGEIAYASCTVSSSGRFFDMSKQVKLTFKKKNGKWASSGDPSYRNQEFVFHEGNEEFYLYTHRNCSEVFQIQNMNSSTITMRYYGHDLASGVLSLGKDEYFNGTEVMRLEYLDKSNCFMFRYFDVGIPYHIYSNYIEAADEFSGNEVVGYQFKKLSAVDPNKYWWFEEAVKAPSD